LDQARARYSQSPIGAKWGAVIEATMPHSGVGWLVGIAHMRKGINVSLTRYRRHQIQVRTIATEKGPCEQNRTAVSRERLVEAWVNTRSGLSGQITGGLKRRRDSATDGACARAVAVAVLILINVGINIPSQAYGN
jgi:hypothetical protein